MKINEEIVRKLNICQGGLISTIEAAEKNNGFYGNSIEESIEILNRLGYPTLAVWVSNNIGKLILVSGEGIYLNIYRIKDLNAETYTEFSDLQAAQQQIESNKQQFLRESPQSLVVNKIVCDEQGNTTWVPVDINSTTEEGHYNVFDPISGLNNLCTTLTEAQTLFKQVQDKYLDLHKAKFILEQKISHPDGDIGWTDTLSQQ